MNGKNVTALKFYAVNAPPNVELLWGLKPQEIDLILGAARGIEIDATNEELASSVNISPYRTSRIISEWQRTGAIRKRRGKLLVCSPKKQFLGAA